MSDNVSVTPGSGAVMACDDVASVFYQRVKLDGGGDGATVPILAGGGVEASSVRVTIASDSTGLVSIDDNGGSVTVDAPVGTPVFVRLSDGAAAITTLPVSVAAGAASIAKAEDVASADADVGVPAMAIQKATPADTAGTDGDYAMHQMSGGRLWTSTVIPVGATTIAKAEDAAHVSGDVGVPALAIQESSPGSKADANGDYANLQMFLGRLWCSTEVTASIGSIGKEEDFPHASGDVGVPALSVRRNTAASTSGSDNDYQPLITDTNGRLHVIESAGTAGDIAHDAADSGNPVKVGGKATALFTLPTAVASADRTNLITDLYGRLIVVSRPDDIKRLGVYYYHSTIFTVAASADGAASAGGGSLWIINPVASGVTVRIRKLTFRSHLGSALATPTSPRITVEKSTFTGTDSGAAITAALRRTADSAAVGKVRTAPTGMTIAASSVVCSFFPIAAATAVAYCSSTEQIFEPGLEDHLDLAAGEVLTVRQADAGTLSDTRRCTLDVVTEEY